MTKNIGISPKGYKDLDPIENFVPNHIDLRNGFISDAGTWNKRAGYKEKWDTGVKEPVHHLIPYFGGYAVTLSGKVFDLGTTVRELTGTKLTGTGRPVSIRNESDIVIVDGGTPIEITPTGIVDLPGSPANFKYITTVGSYTLGAGHTGRTDFNFEFMWSAANNYENWTTGDSGDVRVKKTGIIKNILGLREKLYVFKEEDIEVWYNRGGSTPFARVKIMEGGLKASYSLVQETSTAYWLGDDLRFKRFNQGSQEVISSPYESYIQGLVDPSSIHGHLFKKEHLIKWVVPVDGRVLVLDYKNQTWSEDNHWEHGQWEAMPIDSYMEMDNKQYFGSACHDGLIYEVSPDILDDNGNSIRVFRRFAIPLTDNGNSAKCQRLGFRFKSNVDTATEIDPELIWRYRFNKGKWSNFNRVKIGGSDPYYETKGLGVGREIEFEVIETDAVEYILTNMDLTVLPLGR